ncbi:MAG: redoxin domain-containing protein [Bacteroidia bacterium]
MPKYFILFVFVAFSFKPSEPKIPIYSKFNDFKPLLEKDNDTTYVINFWATWCKPCIEELPYFEAIGEKYKGQKLKIILVSMDFENRVKKGVIPFIEKNKIKSKVVVLDDPAQHEWIPKIDKSWTGAIPATYIYRSKKSKFYEQSFTKEELEKAIKPFLK